MAIKSLKEKKSTTPKSGIEKSSKADSKTSKKKVLDEDDDLDEEEVNDDHTQVMKDTVTLLIDPMSLQYLMGAEIDYQDNLQGSQFVIRNPQAQSTCGCGSSFSV